MHDKNLKWNLSGMFSGDNDYSIEIDMAQTKEKCNEFIAKWKDRKAYLEDPEILALALWEYEKLMANYGPAGKAGYYFSLRLAQEQDNVELKARSNLIENIAKELGNELQFFVNSICRIPKDKQEDFLNYSGLLEYRHFLERCFDFSKYLLSDEEEKILRLKSSVRDKWEAMVEEFFSKEQREVIDENGEVKMAGFSEILKLTSSVNKEVRDCAAEAFNDILKSKIEIVEHEMNALLEDHRINDLLRKRERADTCRLDDDDISSEIVDSLVNAVSSRFELTRRFYRFQTRLLGVEKLKYHERNVPYGNTEKNFTYPEAVALVEKTLDKLSLKFGDIFRGFLREGAIDVMPRLGKRSGAFCIHSLKSLETYILLNYTSRLRDVTTLAHEVGHGINNELMKSKQNALNFETTLATAEVASTFMEDFVVEQLLENADDELKLALSLEILGDSVSTIFRQIAFYRFESELHKLYREKGYLSFAEIGALFKKHMEDYMGEAVEQSAGAENWWAYVGHFRWHFYVYSYASGLLISKYMQAETRKDKKFVEKVEEFLSAGTSESPKELFLKMGIDISDEKFWHRGLDSFELLLGKTEELARKMGKI
mgnify:CR=1 FL=1